jgi:hypothetical protein
MGCCNLLNYVYILVKEKKLENKTHAHHAYSRTSFMVLLLACCHRPVQLCACIANADAGPLLVLTTALLLSCPLRACS